VATPAWTWTASTSTRETESASSRGGEHRVIVYERDGTFARSWGEGFFTARTHGITALVVRERIEVIIGRGDKPSADPPAITPRARQIIELALGEAPRLGHPLIETAHLLLGLLAEGQGIAIGILASRDTSLDDVRKRIELLRRGEKVVADVAFKGGVDLEGLRNATLQVLVREDAVAES
jgi:ATP-dependent Clp protease ATP-binding subunit ClpA